MSDIKAVIFDVDETLTDFISWNRFTTEIGVSLEKHTEIFQSFINQDIPLETAIKKIMENWKSNGPVSFQKIFDIVSDWQLKSDANDTLKYLKSKYNICIISGAIDPYLEIIKEETGIEHVYKLNKFLFNTSGDLEEFTFQPIQTQPKTEYLKDFMMKNQLNAHECCMVGDGDNDFEVFKIVGLSILVKKPNNSHLEKYVNKVVTNLSELKELL